MRRFSEQRVRKFVKAVLAAGLPVKRVAVAPDGSMEAIASLDEADLNDSGNSRTCPNPWDEMPDDEDH